MPPITSHFKTATHWGHYEAEVCDGRLVGLTPIAKDADPSPIGPGMAKAVQDDLRIRQPMVRAGWLDQGPEASRQGRGGEPFVPVSWERAWDLAAAEIKRIKEKFGNQAIYAGGYGWASAGKFHHAQSHMRKFFNLIGGNVKSVNSYSLAAAEVIVPRVVGTWGEIYEQTTTWPVIADHTKLFVMFGGAPLKNAQVDGGGMARHTAKQWLQRCKEAGVEFVNIGPVRDDAAEFLDAEWIAARPNTDTALMMGLAHTLVSEGRYDQAFLDRYTVGWDRFRAYLMGDTDGQPKSAEWAARVTDLDAKVIRSLARRMSETRTLITAAWSLQRAEHGEQPYWMLPTLAAILGQIGLPGGGFGYGYGAVNNVGSPDPKIAGPAPNPGHSPINVFIPSSRVTDMLLNPGATIDYDGQRLTFPDVHMIYWCGGNPFHHHQDLNRLVAAWKKPDTVIVNEPWWNPVARHADIVFPATTPLERNDIGSGYADSYLTPMKRAIDPVGEAKNDFDIFSGLATHFGVGDAFTENRSEEEWLRYLYNVFRQKSAEQAMDLPGFDEFWNGDELKLPVADRRITMLENFRRDPNQHRLRTPSGKIEIYSEKIAGFGYDDCPGHPTWMEPREWLGAALAAKYPLHMISNQPKTRLHSQYDNGGYAQGSKIKGREPIWLHPDDAVARGIADGDIVRVFNDRGACLAGAVVTTAVRRRVAMFNTGAWFDPVEPGKPGSLDAHGNANVLTQDRGTSKLAQGPSAQSCLVEVEKFRGVVPPVNAFKPPPIISRTRKPRQS
ncbi:MAG: molybdopterin guanine dinucleotide-containing S/N-oxide reductase [Alphaproteobacteria bacterium]|nr:molybdopterin guanine dinucleotide-containing S/N-oxide reductase [Alphaproteobacteria bacterium]